MTINRHRAPLSAVVALLGCLATAAPAVAADHRSEPSPLGGDLRYRSVTWTSQGAQMGIRAPRGWSFVLTPDGQARFNAGARSDVLTMGDRGEGSLDSELQGKVAALRGAPGLRVLLAHVYGHGASASAELRYLWTSGGEARFVDYRYRGDDVYMVAGPLADRRGLEGVLNTASSTGTCS